MRQVLSAILLFALAVLPLQARTDGGSLYERGYRGNVGLTFSPRFPKVMAMPWEWRASMATVSTTF